VRLHRLVELLVCAALTGSLSAPLAHANERTYRTCVRTSYETIQTSRPLSCEQARYLGQKAVDTDGQDGVRIQAFGKRWQCTTMLLEDHDRATLFGCFTPYAPVNLDQRYYRQMAVVTILVHAVGDVASRGPVDARDANDPPLVLANGEPLGRGPLQRRPWYIIYSGDGAAFLAGDPTMRSHLSWNRYTSDGGRATGAVWENNCEPDCADGTFHAYEASVHVYRPDDVDGYQVFTRMAIHYLSASLPYTSAARFTFFNLRFYSPGNTFFWDIQPS
jgi:hypothetical protein